MIDDKWKRQKKKRTPCNQHTKGHEPPTRLEGYIHAWQAGGKLVDIGRLTGDLRMEKIRKKRQKKHYAMKTHTKTEQIVVLPAQRGKI